MLEGNNQFVARIQRVAAAQGVDVQVQFLPNLMYSVVVDGPGSNGRITLWFAGSETDLEIEEDFESCLSVTRRVEDGRYQ